MTSEMSTHHEDVKISYGYALKMFLGWSILYMGTLIGFIELLRRNLI
ncbi:hypothetical protein [Acinetobacter junii]|nr:hypothetical protein [Acinetobacter junii]